MFGTEDVDLRIPPSINSISSPPLSVITTGSPTAVSTTAPQNTSPKPSLEAARAKLADATRNSLKSRSRDIDLRQRSDPMDENSQEVNDKFKMILMQAQEQVENSDVNPEQIQSMVQQIIKIKSDSEARKSMKRTNSNLKPIRESDGNTSSEVFSSESDDDNLKKSHRVPNKRHRTSNDEKSSPKTNSTGMSMSNKNTSKSGTVDTASHAPQKERRQRKTKWNSPWEDSIKPTPIIPAIAPAIIPAMPFASNRQNQAPNAGLQDANNRPFSSRNITEPIWQQNPMPFNGPSVANPLAMLNNAAMVPGMIGNMIMAQHGSSAAPCGAKVRTINIDEIPREIRFYDEIAIAFMKDGGLEPKEIGFQSGERRLCVDKNESIVLAFNDTYKPFMINGKPYQIRFGSPTRELYIDSEWYECFFGDPPVGIVLDNKLHVFHIDGPAPQVRIGNLRTDLVVGKVDMFVDMTTKITLFLDAQVQMFQFNNQMHTIQFADYFLTVLIDNIPFSVQYGAMPVKFKLQTAEPYIRFSVLPNDLVPGKVYVRNMVRTNLHRDLVSPPPTASIPPVTGPILPLMSIVPNPDIVASSNSNASLQSTANSGQSTAPVISESSSSAPANTFDIGKINITDLYQKLLATGIINKSKEKEKEKPTPISLAKPETLKKRQEAIVNSLFSGMQCGSCGTRFQLEQTAKYNQHLDWHYRQNRRDRDVRNRAPVRKWYYDVSDWIQYEEIENLDEREKNWFETQQNDTDTLNEDSNQRSNSPKPSCPAPASLPLITDGEEAEGDERKEDDLKCIVCKDPFEEPFYHHEFEEWHLPNAVQIEDKYCHGSCHEDYKVSDPIALFLKTQLIAQNVLLTNIQLCSLKQKLLQEPILNSTNAGDITTDDNAVDIAIKPENGKSSQSMININCV